VAQSLLEALIEDIEDAAIGQYDVMPTCPDESVTRMMFPKHGISIR